MNEIIQSIILAIIQGITEFLPISSSAHLNIIPILSNWSQKPQIINVIIHFATLGAVVLYLKKETRELFYSFIAIFAKKEKKEQKKIALQIIIATMPIVLVGGIFVITDLNEKVRVLPIIATANLVGAILLWYADRYPQKNNQITTKQAFSIGIAQVFAIIPGVSRAGVTITMARILHIERKKAAKFSLMLAIPVIAIATLAEFSKNLFYNNNVQIDQIIILMSISFITAYLAIGLMMRIIEKTGFLPFIIYRILLSLVLFFVIIYQV